MPSHTLPTPNNSPNPLLEPSGGKPSGSERAIRYRPGLRPRRSGPPRAALAAAMVAGALALSGCAGTSAPAGAASSAAGNPAPGSPAPSEASGAPSSGRQASSVQLSDAWVKSVDGGMTGAFAVLRNSGDTAAVLVAASADAAERVELHEMAGSAGSATMREKEDGIAVPAGGQTQLAPGGLHLMLMGLTDPLAPGDSLRITLEYADGSSSAVDFLVKDFTGANESYAPGADRPAGGEDGSDGASDAGHSGTHSGIHSGTQSGAHPGGSGS
ncbi:copper chaperone PCu(A)C [Arthrobacter halodurans]|uniref:Copper chaperone PCu(A)C n=1 Tax=Arthrobacter halodurans TaxID=516699 RepID=A0ABV4UNN4_9MICC